MAVLMSTKTPLPVTSSPPAAKPPEAGRHLALEITGMTCASCVRRVEHALEEVPGAAAATVNLAALPLTSPSPSRSTPAR